MLRQLLALIYSVLPRMLCIGALLLVPIVTVQAAVDPFEFPTDEDQKRYQMFLEELRCPKCKNNNLAGTNSQIAIDLRRELQRMVVDGQTDEQIVDFMVSRYGDFVLYRPRMDAKNFIIWVAPGLFLTIALIIAGGIMLKRRKVQTATSQSGGLSEEEQRELDRLLSASEPPKSEGSGGKRSKKKHNKA